MQGVEPISVIAFEEEIVPSLAPSKEPHAFVRTHTLCGEKLQNQVSMHGENLSPIGFQFLEQGVITVKNDVGCKISRCDMNNPEGGQSLKVDSSSGKLKIDHDLFEKKKIFEYQLMKKPFCCLLVMSKTIQPSKFCIRQISSAFLASTVLFATDVSARTWTSADGKKTIEGELIDYDAGTGQVILDRDGRKVNFNRDFLSPEDIAFLKDKATAGPPAGIDWKPIPELTDEFDEKTLDATKWHDHNPSWLGRYPGLFSRNNVSVSDGKLHLTARLEDPKHPDKKFHTFTTAAVKSKALALYGYFEIKCRPMKSKASSAFWFYRDEKDIWTEIDVFEICGVDDKWKNSYNMNAHVFHTPTEKKHFQRPGTWKAPFNFVDGFHVYALEWNKDAIKWWVNGKVVHEMKNTHWHQALYMNFDSETFPEWFGLPDKASLPATFSIEYIRSWSRVDLEKLP